MPEEAKDCNIVSQMSETLDVFSQEKITVKETCIRRSQKRRLAKEIFGVERANVSNSCGHEGSKYLGMR